MALHGRTEKRVAPHNLNGDCIRLGDNSRFQGPVERAEEQIFGLRAQFLSRS
jgi:hypothetical protein